MSISPFLVSPEKSQTIVQTASGTDATAAPSPNRHYVPHIDGGSEKRSTFSPPCAVPAVVSGISHHAAGKGASAVMGGPPLADEAIHESTSRSALSGGTKEISYEQ